MWFKNLQIYQFTDSFSITPEELEAALKQQEFRPCPRIMPSSTGWVAPVGDSDNASLVHAPHGLMLIKLKTESKIIPAESIKERLGVKVKKLEEEFGRKLLSKEKLSIRDEAYADMLPQAFSKTSNMQAIIDLKRQLLLVDASTKNKAEDFITYLRKTLGSLPIETPDLNSPRGLMTAWLKTQAPNKFFLGDSCVLDSSLSSSSAKFTKEDVLSPNVQAFIDDGMEVVQLKMQWQEHLQFTLKENLSINQIKFSDVVMHQVGDIYIETQGQSDDAEFFIMSQTLLAFVDDIRLLFFKRDG